MPVVPDRSRRTTATLLSPVLAASSKGLRRAAGRCVAAGAGLALAAGLLAGPGDAGQGDGVDASRDLQPVARATRSPQLRTFSLNVAFPLGKARAKADMRRAMTGLGASVGGFQEMSQAPDRQSVMELCRELDWGWYMPVRAGKAIPVVFDRDRFRLVEGRSIKVHGPERKVTPSRYINVVRLRELSTGKVFGIINTHAISGASHDAQASNMHRIPRLRKHIRMLREAMEDTFRTTEHVVAMGDLNVNYLADRRRRVAGLPTRVLGPVVDFDMPLKGSRGPTSLLDYVMTMSRGSGVSRAHASIVRGFNSDHSAVVLTWDPNDLFAPGPLTNAPNGGTYATRTVLSKWSRAIGDTEEGATVRVATPRITDPRVTDDLIAADARGVAVRVLLAGGAQTDQEQRLLAALGDGSAAEPEEPTDEPGQEPADGTDEPEPEPEPATGSWLQAAASDSVASFLLADRAGGTTALSISTSSPVTDAATGSLADGYLASRDRIYSAFLAAFDDLEVGAPESPSAGGALGGGGHRVWLGPVGQHDPLVRAVRPIRCKGDTQVRVSMREWSGERGLGIARKLAGKARWGCSVRVLAGDELAADVEYVLRSSGVAVRRVAVAQSMLAVDGRYGSRDRGVAWAGTLGMSDAAYDRTGQLIQINAKRVADAYAAQFDGRWRHHG